MKRKEIQLDKEEQRLFNESLKKYVQSKGYSMEDIPYEIGNRLIMKFVSNCKRCELCRNKSVLPLYNSSPRAIIINQVSGSQEEKKEIILPTTYPAGKVFDKWVTKDGVEYNLAKTKATGDMILYANFKTDSKYVMKIILIFAAAFVVVVVISAIIIKSVRKKRAKKDY